MCKFTQLTYGQIIWIATPLWRVIKLALAFSPDPVPSNAHHHYLPLHSSQVVLGPVVGPEPEPESMPEVALVAFYGTANVYMLVATHAVQKITYTKIYCVNQADSTKLKPVDSSSMVVVAIF